MIQKKHIVLLNGSPRKKTTRDYLDGIASLLDKKGIESEIIDIGDYTVKYCTGCERCIRETSWCVFEDDSRTILEKILQSDGLIISSPVFMGTVTGKLKSLLDKTASWLHRPPAAGLPVLPLVTTAGSGEKATLDYLAEAVTYWGAHPVKGISRNASNREPVRGEELESFFSHVEMPKERYKPSLHQVMLFQVQKVLALKVSRLDREYWNERDWDTRDYYYRSKISLLKKLLGKILFAVLYRSVQPTEPF